MTSPAINPLVFVYGSLKKGFHNHYPFLADRHALPLGAATTVDPYLMLSASAFPYLIDPASLSADHEACIADVIGKVKGELYVVDPETMDMLDRLEGHPDYYRRREWAAAILAFEEALQMRPGDGPASEMLRRCRTFQREPPNADWDGVNRLGGK